MQLTKGDIMDFSAGMAEYNQIKEKDKGVKDITDERLLKLGYKVKYSIIKNHNQLKNEIEVIEEILNDQFRKIGGVIKPDGTGYWTDPQKLEDLRTKHKADKTTFKKEAKKLQDAAEKKAEKYLDFRTKLMEEPITEEKDQPKKFALMTLAPSAQDVSLLPESLISWYMEKDLFKEPAWDEEEIDKTKP
jgi:hypothetical protein